MPTRLQQFNCRHAENLSYYEGHLTEKNGRKTRAQRYRLMMKRLGGDRVQAAIRSVNRQQPSAGLKGLAAIDRLRWSDEHLVCEFPDLFPDDVVRRAADALEKVRALVV